MESGAKFWVKPLIELPEEHWQMSFQDRQSSAFPSRNRSRLSRPWNSVSLVFAGTFTNGLWWTPFPAMEEKQLIKQEGSSIILLIYRKLITDQVKWKHLWNKSPKYFFTAYPHSCFGFFAVVKEDRRWKESYPESLDQSTGIIYFILLGIRLGTYCPRKSALQTIYMWKLRVIGCCSLLSPLSSVSYPQPLQFQIMEEGPA